MKILPFLFISVLFNSFSFAATIKPATPVTSGSSTAISQTKQLLILGDSLTEGYGVAQQKAFPALVEEKIKKSGKSWKVINSGVSGATSASALSRMKWAFKNKPDLVLLVLGANDGLRGLTVEQTKKNLELALDYAKAEKVPVILGGLYMPPNYGAKFTEDFKKMYSSLASRYKVPLIPFILDKVAGKAEYNQTDGIHPNEKGHAIIAETVYTALGKYL
ncbi:MAG: arylesterase [Bdellovibrionota bacterium]